MTLPNIDFAGIRAHDGSRNAGFEELCCQLAGLEPRVPESRFFRKGRGGDAGVECFIRLTNGNETGWQAKYVMSWGQPLARQLDGSIATALAKHPRLTDYIVCLPFDLSDPRAGTGKTALEQWERWCKKWIDDAKKSRRKLAIHLWGKHELTTRLARDDPPYAGRLAYWFDQTSFTQDWFRHQFEKARVSLGSRYTPETNVDLPIRQDFLGFTRDPSLNTLLIDVNVDAQGKVHWAIDATRDVAGKRSPLAKAMEQDLRAVVSGFSVLPITSGEQFPVELWAESANRLRNSVRIAHEATYDLPAKRRKPKASSGGMEPIARAQRYLFDASGKLRNLVGQLGTDRWALANHRAILLYGQAGTGKSHLLADVVQHHIACGFPGILVLGSNFVDGEPWRQILNQLDLPATIKVAHFLGALDAAAQASGVRAVICVDALNERNGVDVWPHRLAAFLKEAEPFAHVGVVVSCRTTYMRVVVPSTIPGKDLHRIEHIGFSGPAVEAAKVYLDKRGIMRPGAPNLLPEFENPLFLKTCCDYLEKEGKRELPKGLSGVSQIFTFYVEAVADALNQRMHLDVHADVPTRGIRALANAIVTRGTGYLEKHKAIEILEAIHRSNNDRERSLLTQLESEGMIAIEIVREGASAHSEEVRFTFERFSDHQIATALLKDHLSPSNPQSSFLEGAPLHQIVLGTDAYRRSGIIEALSVQLPELVGAELIDLLPEESNAWHLADPFINSVTWRDQHCFTQRTLEILSDNVGPDECELILFSLATEPSNTFNASLLHQRLGGMTLPERDACWTRLINQAGEREASSINMLTSWAIANGLEAIDDDRAELTAIALAWLLSASNRSVRDRATKGLACILARRLALAGALIRRFALIDDPYIIERVMGASYGAVVQGLVVQGATELAHSVYETTFASGNPPMNALLRDHASGILQYLNWRGLLPEELNLTQALPPYKSPWPIEHVSDEEIDAYKQRYGEHLLGDQIVSSAVKDGDFARYQIDPLVGHWTQAPLGAVNPPTEEEVAKGWMTEFEATGNNAQLETFVEVLKAAQVLKGEPTGYQDTPDTLKFKECERNFRETLMPDQWEDYRIKARSYVQHSMYSSRMPFAGPELFDSGWARRWVCKRAHEFGWTPERFGEIERYRGGEYGRMEHRIERIGKKYQWMALWELAGRMADNLAMRNESWGGEAKTQLYRGAWQVGLRQMDPSLLTVSTYYDGWGEWPRTWWVPFAPTMQEIPRKERLVWRDTMDDVVNDAKLIDLRDPRDGRHWLALDGFASWHQRGVVSGDSQLQRDTWFRLGCVIAHRKDRAQLLKFLSAEFLTEPDRLPEIELHGDQYLGEYPWHPSWSDVEDWRMPGSFRSFPVPVRGAVATYSQERSGYDFSIEKTLRIGMPAPWLMNAMGLRLSNGRTLTYVSSDGTVRFFDPSVSEPGPHAALVDRDAFVEVLARQKLCAFWVIAGEKGVYSDSRSQRGWGGRLAHSFVYELQGDRMICRNKNIKTERPSAEQLKEFLGEDGTTKDQPAKKKQRVSKRTK